MDYSGFNPPKVLVVDDFQPSRLNALERLNAEQVLFSMRQAMECRDPDTSDHCDRLAQQAEKMGRFLKLSHLERRHLIWGAYLHDIGKVTTPDHILFNDGNLSAAEWDIMRDHVIAGEKLCQPFSVLRGVLPIIRHHHERWDGSGYPDGLASHDIPFLAKVFQCLDVYDALTSQRPYKPALSSAEALQVMGDEADNGWYDPTLMETFMAFIRCSPTTTL